MHGMDNMKPELSGPSKNTETNISALVKRTFARVSIVPMAQQQEVSVPQGLNYGILLPMQPT
jgi:hypothetical protein